MLLSISLVLNRLTRGRKVTPLWAGAVLVGSLFAVAGLAYLSIPTIADVRPCRDIAVSTDKSLYARGETVSIHIEYLHLGPNCGESLMLHVHPLSVDANGVSIESWNVTDDSVRDIA